MCTRRHGVVTPISTIIYSDLTGIVTPYMGDIAVVWVWLMVFPSSLQTSDVVKADFCQGCRVTATFSSVVMKVSGCFLMLTGCDSSQSCEYGTYWSDRLWVWKL